MEKANAARDEHRNLQPAGFRMTIGDPDGDEITGDEYQAFLERITVEDVLEATFGYWSEDDCEKVVNLRTYIGRWCVDG